MSAIVTARELGVLPARSAACSAAKEVPMPVWPARVAAPRVACTQAGQRRVPRRSDRRGDPVRAGQYAHGHAHGQSVRQRRPHDPRRRCRIVERWIVGPRRDRVHRQHRGSDPENAGPRRARDHRAAAGALAPARTRLYRMLDAVGHWSMLDVYVVALLVGLVRFAASPSAARPASRRSARSSC